MENLLMTVRSEVGSSSAQQQWSGRARVVDAVLDGVQFGPQPAYGACARRCHTVCGKCCEGWEAAPPQAAPPAAPHSGPTSSGSTSSGPTPAARRPQCSGPDLDGARDDDLRESPGGNPAGPMGPISDADVNRGTGTTTSGGPEWKPNDAGWCGRAVFWDIKNRLPRSVTTIGLGEHIRLGLTGIVDTHWKKQPLGVNNSNAAAVKSTTTTASAAPLLRSQSMRTNVAAGGIRNLPTVAGRAAAAANAKVNATGKLIPIGKLVDGEPKIAQPKTLTFNLNQNTTIEYQRRHVMAVATSRQQRYNYNYNNLANMHANVIIRPTPRAAPSQLLPSSRCRRSALPRPEYPVAISLAATT
ncbi:hypothetical protein ACLKA6_016064, partial [Drosophila palustris]